MSRSGEIWIFGYGSLMWDPGFSYVEARPALLRGYHRAFCIVSHRYRGTPERPGLVLGLEAGGSCRGRAYRIDPAREREVFAYLHEREMLFDVYDRRRVPVRLDGGRRVMAHTYVADRTHERYTGRLSAEEVARRILRSRGSRGSNLAYLENTVRHLDDLGIRDGPLHRLLDMVKNHSG